MSNINSLLGAISAKNGVDISGIEDILAGFDELIDAKTTESLENALANLQKSVQEQGGSIADQRQEIYKMLLDNVPYENQDALSDGLSSINEILTKLYQSASADPENVEAYANEARQTLADLTPGLIDAFANTGAATKSNYQISTDVGVNAAMQTPRLGASAPVTVAATSGGQGSYTSQVNFASDMITNLLNGDSNVSILLISMLVFLAMADIDSAVIQTDATLITANQAYQKTLAQASSAMQALESVLPYPDPNDSSKTVDDMYTLYQIAYGGGGYTADDNLRKSLEPFTDWLKATDSADMDALISGGFPSGSEKDLENALNTAMNNTNQALAHVGATTMPLFSYDSDNKPILDSSKIQTQVSDLSSGMTAASSISQQENIVFQSHNETLNQHLQAAVNSLSTYKTINQRIWAQ